MANRRSKRAATPPAADAKPELVPLNDKQRATLTLCANRYGMKHAIATAAAVEHFIRKPDALAEFAAEIEVDVDQLPQLLEPYPDAATLKATNDK